MIALAASMAALHTSASLSETRDEKKPNVVLIVADNLGRESVGTYGGNIFSTPRIDAIGRDGVIFDQCYIGTPLCSPARAGLMTGRYPQWAGVHGQPNPKKPAEGNLASDEVTLAQTLKAAGYHTGLFGKWNLGYDETLLPTRRGFDRYYGINAGNADYFTHIYAKDGKKYFYSDTEQIDPIGYVDNLCVDEALKWLDGIDRSVAPFFLEVAFFTPHGPYQSPPGYPTKGSDEEVYGYMIDNMDKNVGRIIDKIEELDAAADTLVVFISDQGASSKNRYRRDLTEGGLKVVCHALWPGHTVPGTRVAAPFISYDWFTTLTELGGGTIPSDRIVVGKNISHLFRGHGRSPHKALYWTFRNEDAIRQGDWKLHMSHGAVRGLYHLAEDPAAQRDLASEHPEKVQELRQKIAMHKAQGAERSANTASAREFGRVEVLVSNWLRMDKDGDDKVSEDEAQGRLKASFKRNDANQDGFLMRSELAALAQRLRGGQNRRTNTNRNQSTNTGRNQSTNTGRSQSTNTGRSQSTNTNRDKPTMSTEELLKRAPDGVTIIPDIAYREGNDAWKLDLAMPKERGDAPRAAIIYIHGGGWTKGDKRGQGIGAVLDYAAKGYVSISVNYRLDVDKMACIEDVKCATRWLRAHAEQYNVDPNRIGAAGNSAGGHFGVDAGRVPEICGTRR